MATSSHSALLFSLICAMHTCTRPANKFLCTVSSKYYGASFTVPVATRMLCQHPTVFQDTMLIQAAFEADDKHSPCCSLVGIFQVGSGTEQFDVPKNIQCTPEACALEYSLILGHRYGYDEWDAFQARVCGRWDFVATAEEDGKTVTVADHSYGNRDAVTSEDFVYDESRSGCHWERKARPGESSDEEFENNEADFDKDGKSNDNEEDFKAADDATSEDLNADKADADVKVEKSSAESADAATTDPKTDSAAAATAPITEPTATDPKTEPVVKSDSKTGPAKTDSNRPREVEISRVMDAADPAKDENTATGVQKPPESEAEADADVKVEKSSAESADAATTDPKTDCAAAATAPIIEPTATDPKTEPVAKIDSETEPAKTDSKKASPPSESKAAFSKVSAAPMIAAFLAVAAAWA